MWVKIFEFLGERNLFKESDDILLVSLIPHTNYMGQKTIFKQDLTFMKERYLIL